MEEGLIYVFLSGLGIGFAGNLHCVGMCGPLVIAGASSMSGKNSVLSSLLYHKARIIAYIFLGLAFGYIGQTISLVVFQQWISIVAALLIFAYLFIYYSTVNSRIDKLQWIQILKTKISELLYSPDSYWRIMQLGFLNGLLPCGLVYIAGITAAASGSYLTGSVLMLGFGMATFPVMLGIMIMGRKFSFQHKSLFSKLSPIMIFSVAVLLLLRGMNLGIPYISPKLENNKMECCNKGK
ncbi:MAG: sulfite exporter TauE/SafE family protein [Saprospiraceae bacterium]|nr:sulfite exporter TauE/SafE family protein [Saprospiraceae bacterium]